MQITFAPAVTSRSPCDKPTALLRSAVHVMRTRGANFSFSDFFLVHPITGHQGPRRGGWSAPRPGRFTPGKDPVPIVQEAEWAPGPGWTFAKNLAPTGIRSPDRPARSQSLYRLGYPAHLYWCRPTEIGT
jgi:hypothetical protein